jgi:hypothetical protein
VQITQMSLAKVAHGAVPAPPELRDIDAGINAFLGDHITGLRGMTTKRKSYPGKFIESESQRLFEDLYLGTNEAFLAAADSLTKRLIAKMDRRTSEGLLVCLRARDDQEQYGGVLKLQVVAPNAAVLEELESGEVKLSAVTDLLDKPGDLQKGALRTSWLAEDRVMVGDQLAQDASYFPVAFGIRTFARASSSVSGLLTAVDKVDTDLTAPIAQALPSVAAGDASVVLAELAKHVPGLSPPVRTDVMHALEKQPRPVAQIDTSQRATETIKAGAITISGPVVEMRKHVHIDLGDSSDSGGSGSWVIRVESAHKPRRNHP